MDYKIVIDPSKGGEDIGLTYNNLKEKEFTLNLANYINNRLKELGIKVYLTRNNDVTLSEEERVNLIKNNYGNRNDVIVISLKLNNSLNQGEIIYALRNSSGLSSRLATNLNNIGFNIDKYYQRRLPSDASKDYYYLIRETNNNQSLIIDLGKFNDNLINNYELIGETIVKTIANYIGVNYTPETFKNTYIVKKGDSLYSIARTLNTTVDELKRLNNLSSNLLSIGQVLKIPSSTNTSINNTYTVKKGDSLYSIARIYNTSVDELKRLNNLTSNLLSIDQVLKLPSSTNTNNTYIVKKGDSLYSIARNYNTTVDKLKNINNISSNLLSIGQVLKIN